MTGTCLIGRGFVGEALQRQLQFDHVFSRRDIASLRWASASPHFKLLVIAAMPAAVYKANDEPVVDVHTLIDLLDVLRVVTADRVVLISTVNVYGVVQRAEVVSERTPAVPSDTYGKHRLMLEHACAALFADKLLTLRLPALFGKGLRKNFLFDLLTDNPLANTINDSALFQWFSVDRLPQLITDLDIGVYNVVTDPISAGALRSLFPESRQNIVAPSCPCYRLRTRHLDSGSFGDAWPELKAYIDVAKQWPAQYLHLPQTV
jgi:nucleoside-diphosphate-sugar epimerase